jgi:hypothetical protein
MAKATGMSTGFAQYRQPTSSTMSTNVISAGQIRCQADDAGTVAISKKWGVLRLIRQGAASARKSSAMASFMPNERHHPEGAPAIALGQRISRTETSGMKPRFARA